MSIEQLVEPKSQIERLAIVETKVDQINEKIDKYFKLSDGVVCNTNDIKWMKKIEYFVIAPSFVAIAGTLITLVVTKMFS